VEIEIMKIDHIGEEVVIEEEIEKQKIDLTEEEEDSVVIEKEKKDHTEEEVVIEEEIEKLKIDHTEEEEDLEEVIEKAKKDLTEAEVDSEEEIEKEKRDHIEEEEVIIMVEKIDLIEEEVALEAVKKVDIEAEEKAEEEVTVNQEKRVKTKITLMKTKSTLNSRKELTMLENLKDIKALQDLLTLMKGRVVLEEEEKFLKMATERVTGVVLRKKPELTLISMLTKQRLKNHQRRQLKEKEVKVLLTL